MSRIRYSLVLLCVLLGTSCLVAQEDNSEQALQTIRSKIEKNKSKIQEKRQAKRLVEQELGSLSRELKHTEVHLQNAQKKLSQTQQRIRQTQSQLLESRHEYGIKNQQFSNRLRDIYKNKNMEVLEFIFSPNNLVSAMDSSYYFERLMKSDLSMIEDMKSRYGTLVQAHKTLQKQNQNLTQLKLDIAEKESKLEQKKSDQKHYLDSLHAEISQMERDNRELEQSSQEITSQIMRYAKGKKGYYGTGRFVKPCDGWLSSLFGIRFHPIFKRRIRHMGIDLAGKYGTPIRAADSGVVIVSGEPAQYRGYGKITVIDHGQGKDGRRISTVYAHQSQLMVREGDTVRQGQVIGLVGSTGHATGPHLHFEVRLDGIPVDPLNYVHL